MKIETRYVVVLRTEDKEKLEDLVKSLSAVYNGDCMNDVHAKENIDEVICYLQDLMNKIN